MKQANALSRQILKRLDLQPRGGAERKVPFPFLRVIKPSACIKGELLDQR